MAQADTEIDMSVGSAQGSTDECQHCGGQLDYIGGTDPFAGGPAFQEQYKCLRCGNVGTFKDKLGETRYTGVCEDTGL